MKEVPKKAWGSSIQALEEAREKGRSETFSLDYEASFTKMIEILKKMNSYIYIKDKKRHLIVAMHFQGPDDTTEVGIFFTEKGPDLTQIELSSTSSSLLDYISNRIFSRMSKN